MTRKPQERKVRRPAAASRSLTSRLLVATDGAESADGAIRFAAALAARDGGSVEVISVTSPMPAVPPMTGIVSDIGLLASYEATTEIFGPAQTERVSEQLARLGVADWPLRSVTGWPAQEIAAMAKKHRATLVVMGIGRHKPIDRLLGSEVALQVVRQSEAPVLCVPRDRDRIPRRVLVGVDFSLASESAARAALAIIGDGGALRLVHVRPAFEFPVPNQERWIELYEEGATLNFDRLVRSLEPPTGVVVETAVARGDAGRELLVDAAAIDADLLVVGAQRQTRGERILLGSVVAKAIRGATCAVLVMPAVAAPSFLARPRLTAGRASRARQPA